MPNEMPQAMCDVIMDEWYALELDAQILRSELGEKMSEQLDQTTDEKVAEYQQEIDAIAAELDAVEAAKEVKVDEMTDGHCYGLAQGGGD